MCVYILPLKPPNMREVHPFTHFFCLVGAVSSVFWRVPVPKQPFVMSQRVPRLVTKLGYFSLLPNTENPAKHQVVQAVNIRNEIKYQTIKMALIYFNKCVSKPMPSDLEFTFLTLSCDCAQKHWHWPQWNSLYFSACITNSCNRRLAQIGSQDGSARRFVWKWDVDELV